VSQALRSAAEPEAEPLRADAVELLPAVAPQRAVYSVANDPARPKAPRRRLGELLVEAGLIDAAQLQEALIHQKAHGGRLGSTLVALGYLSDRDLEGSLGRQLGLQTCEVESIHPPPEVLRLVPEALIRKYEVIPLELRGRTLVLGMTDPGNFCALDEIRFSTSAREVEPRLITETTYRRFLTTRFAAAMLMDQIAGDETWEDITDGAVPPEADASRRRRPDEDAEASTPPVIRLVNYVLHQSVQQRASDVHIEPYESFLRIRFRVDGKLYTVVTPPQRIQGPVVSRIKILAAMDIAERRKPQDGHMVLPIEGEQVHFRVSVLPTVYGEKCVIRLLKKEAHLADIERLGFRGDQLAAIRKVARMPQGLVLVTGPTGSGKTTTLHAILNFINEPDVNIVTIEDPVESSIPGVNHVQVQEKGGVNFASALRSILRQDPDVVFVGEMRDPEVSKIAIRASLTGHLVLSTLHTNGVIETFGRLVDQGVETYLLASCLRMVLAQRLLRRLCSFCARRDALPAALAAEFQLTDAQRATAIHKIPKGCRRCLDTGYKGRVAVYESIVPNDDLREILRRGGSEEELAAAARRMGFVSMVDSAVARALAGETTLDEVRRVLVSPG